MLRKTKRYSISVPASFRWEPADGVLREGQGTTRDISSHGVFVVTTVFPQVGEHLQIEVCLPSLSGTAESVQLRGEGTVVRASRPESGFAAQVTFH